MKKIIIPILAVILALMAFWFFKYDSLERQLILKNISHHLDWDFDGVLINEQLKTITITFEKARATDKTFDNIKDTFNNCSDVIKSNPKYNDYAVDLVIANDKRPIFIMSDVSCENPEYIYCSININSITIPLSEIGKNYPNIKQLHLDDLRFYKVPEQSEWTDTQKDVYSEYCNIDNYKAFTQLEYIKFCIKPDDSVIDYLNEKFPNCTVEWENDMSTK